MNNNELHRPKYLAQMDEWKADIAKLKLKASRAKEDVQLAINMEVAALERRLENYQAKLLELAAANEDTCDSIKKGVESAWNTMKSALGAASLKFNS